MITIRGLLVDHNKWMADSKENLKNEILGAKGLTKRTVTVTWLTSFFSQLLTKSLCNKNIKHTSDQTLLSRRIPLPGQFLWLRYKTCFLYKSNYKEISSLLMTYVSKQTNKQRKSYQPQKHFKIKVSLSH